MDTLFDKICCGQQGNEDALSEIVQRFSPLLRKYAYKLHTEDAYADLQLFLINFIHSIDFNSLHSCNDGILVNYISNAIYHQYISLSKKSRKYTKKMVSLDDLSELDPLEFDKRCSESDTYNQLLLCDLRRILTTSEYQIIYAHFFRQYSIAEIALMQGKSRQAINQTKNNALKKLQVLLK